VGQQQTDRSGEPPLGQCVVCGQPVTRDDPGKIQFDATDGRMTNVHIRCANPA
jgi:hypothetical protein